MLVRKREPVINEQTISAVLAEYLVEERKDRRIRKRWRAIGTAGKIFFFGFIALMVLSTSQMKFNNLGGNPALPHVAVVPVTGVISNGGNASDQKLIPVLKRALKNSESRGLILKINSPGGSAVVSARLYQALLDLKDRYPDKPIVSVVDDMAASGGYYIAAATDRIYADPASIVGSIGVISSSFGADKLIGSFGVERRIFTGGSDKAFLDPFAPLSQKHAEHWQQQLDFTHAAFIQAVKSGRGERLTPGDTDLFSGLVWVGADAKRLGLIDDFGSLDSVLESEFGLDNRVTYAPPRSPFASFTQGVSAAIAERLVPFTHATPTLEYAL